MEPKRKPLDESIVDLLLYLFGMGIMVGAISAMLHSQWTMACAFFLAYITTSKRYGKRGDNA